MHRKQLLDLVRKFDLNEYEAKAFTALMGEGVLAAAEISKKALIPRPRVYDVLLGLERKGFIAALPGRPAKFQALSLDIALQNYEKTRQRDLYYKLEELKETKSQLENAIPKASKASESAEVLILRGRTNIYSKLSELMNNASKEVTIMAPKDALARKKSFFEKDLLKAKNSKIRVKLLESDSRAVLVDSKAMLFLDKDNEEHERALLVHSPFLAESLKKKV